MKLKKNCIFSQIKEAMLQALDQNTQLSGTKLKSNLLFVSVISFSVLMPVYRYLECSQGRGIVKREKKLKCDVILIKFIHMIRKMTGNFVFLFMFVFLGIKFMTLCNKSLFK